jgi:hypothetical protein
MEWTFRKALRLKKADLGRVYDELKQDLGTVFHSLSFNHVNCSINHEDFIAAYRLEIKSVLFQNKHNQQALVSFEKAIELYKKGDKKTGSDGAYTVISWQSITGQHDFPDDDLPF